MATSEEDDAVSRQQDVTTIEETIEVLHIVPVRAGRKARKKQTQYLLHGIKKNVLIQVMS